MFVSGLKAPRAGLGALVEDASLRLRLCGFQPIHLWQFGRLLGDTTALGMLFGLPLDIRHIAFSSAYVGYSVAALDFTLPWQTVTFALAGVLLIGLVNLTVRFSLTLTVATRACRISFAQGRTLGHLLLRRFLKRPQDFLLPPLRGTTPEARPATSESSTSPSPPPPAPNASQPLGPDAPNG